MSARNSILPVFVPHLGCPHACVFCNQRKISGSLKPATAEEVRSTISAALAAIPGNAEVAFYGGSFTAIEKEQQRALLASAESFFSTGRISGIRLSTRPDAVDEEVVSFLKEHHVTTVELGIQSMDDRVLSLSERGHTAADAVRAAETVKASGMKLILQMMTGLPGASPESDLQTAERIAALHPDGVRIYPAVIIKDTVLCEMWEKGTYPEHTVEDAVCLCAQILPVFQRNNIPVIRLGLNPTDDLSAGEAVAGAYHPALGELVMARVLRNAAEEKLCSMHPGSGDSMEITVHPRRISQMVGQHRCNLTYLRERFDLKDIRVVPGDMEENKILIKRK